MAVNINKGSALSALNITPMIDIVFLLLIFFMVTSRFAAEDRELEVTLPSASSAMPLIVQPQEMFVNVDRAGGYFVNGRTYDVPSLGVLLRQAETNNPGQRVIIRADKAVAFDHVVAVMDLCNQAGIVGYSVATATE